MRLQGRTFRRWATIFISLQWRHNERDGVVNHRRLDYLLNLFQAQIKENIKAPRNWPLWGEFAGDRWIPLTKGQQRGKYFHMMTSSWMFCIWFIFIRNLFSLWQWYIFFGVFCWHLSENHLTHECQTKPTYAFISCFWALSTNTMLILFTGGSKFYCLYCLLL